MYNFFSTDNLQGKKLNVQDNMKTSQIHQLHHKQRACALPRRQPADYAPPGGHSVGLQHQGWQSSRESDVTAFLGEVEFFFSFFGNSQNGTTEGVKG